MIRILQPSAFRSRLSSSRHNICPYGRYSMEFRKSSSLSDPFKAPSSHSDDQKLRNDVKMLGQILGNIIKQDDESVFNSVEKLRLLGRKVIVIASSCISLISYDFYSFVVAPIS